jgi:hypothetical protein
MVTMLSDDSRTGCDDSGASWGRALHLSQTAQAVTWAVSLSRDEWQTLARLVECLRESRDGAS